MREFVVRPLQPADVPSAFAVARELSKWFNADGLEKIRRDLGLHEGFVAVDDTRLLGFATWHPLDSETAELSWIGVVEEEQGRGVGTALLAAIAGATRRHGHRFLDVATVADSLNYQPYEGTRRFYRARGFSDYRVDSKFYGKGDDRYDRLLLRLAL